MNPFAALDRRRIDGLIAELKPRLAVASTLDGAAQTLTDVIFEAYADSLALARFYATIPFARLPASVARFVADLARAKGVAAELRESTPVLTLLGTRGTQRAWNSRHLSRGHVGIPLTSARFVEAIPMISRLLTELGVDLAWVDREDEGIAAQAATTGLGGVFYVHDAATVVDRAGRHVIPAQDFVASEGVQTVFGAGVTYVDGMLGTLILFTREHVEREQAELFLPLMKAFKLATTVIAITKGQLMDGA